MKVIFLGNEFISDDSLAVEVFRELEKELGEMELTHVKSSFGLMAELQNGSEMIIVDVVMGLCKTRVLSIEDLKFEGAMSAHDFDAGFFLKLMGEDKKIVIIGIPMKGELGMIKSEVKNLIQSQFTFKK